MPKVKCKLAGQDGNAFAILGRFQEAARRAGWTREDIKQVIDEATAGNYDHLLHTITQHCQNP